MRRRSTGVGKGLVRAAVWACLLPGAGAGQEVVDPDGGAVVTLEEAVRSALATHPSLEAARARLEASESAVGEARASWLPVVAAQGLAMRYEEPMVVAPLHGFDPMSPPMFDRTLLQAHATAEWVAFDGGARRGRIAAARRAAEAVAAGVEGVAETVVVDAVTAYVAATTAEAVLVAHAELASALAAERDRASLLLGEGRTPRVALLRAEAALSRARADLEAARERHALALHRLARVTGLDAARLSGGLTAPAAEDAGAEARVGDREALVSAARSGNPELERARRAAGAAEAAVAVARSAYLPRVGVAARYSGYGSAESALEPEWNAGVQVSWPVFTGGARARAVERAAAEARAARSEAATVARQVEDAVDAALAAYRTARARVEALTVAVAQSEEVARIEALALEAGAGVQTDYLRAQAELLQTRAALAEARGAALEARVRLARATGALSLGWISETLREGDR